MVTLPHTQWWIKSDGCDVVPGLMESTQGVWNGDVDLGDGSLESLYSAYCDRLSVIDGICCDLSHENSRRGEWHDLLKLKPGIVDDRHFIDEGTWGIYVVILHNYESFYSALKKAISDSNLLEMRQTRLCIH